MVESAELAKLRQQAAAWKTSGGNTTAAATDAADGADGLFGAAVPGGLVDGGSGGGEGKVESPAGL